MKNTISFSVDCVYFWSLCVYVCLLCTLQTGILRCNRAEEVNG